MTTDGNDEKPPTARSRRGPGNAGVAPQSDFIEVALMRALADELRVRVYAYLCEYEAGAAEVAKALGAPKNSVRYHVAELVQDGLIDADRTTRGKKYRALRPAVVPTGVWDRMPSSLRRHVAVRMMRRLFADAGESMEAGLFFRPGVHLSLTPMVVDAQGQREVKKLLEATVDGLLAIQAESNTRMEESGRDDSQGVPLTVAVAGYEAQRDPAEGLKASQTVRL